MANTYTQIHIHAVFSVQNRHCIIQNSWKGDLYAYITGIIKNNNHHLLAINGMPDHVHLLIGMRPFQSLSNLMQDIKGSSSEWINRKGIIQSRFSWQEGYGAFSCGRQEVERIIGYIHNQEFHHTAKSFSEEYLEILKNSQIPFNEEYLFKSVNYH